MDAIMWIVIEMMNRIVAFEQFDVHISAEPSVAKLSTSRNIVNSRNLFFLRSKSIAVSIAILLLTSVH